MMERKRAMSSIEPNRVRIVRESRGLSQVALAAAASLTRQSVGAIEAGRATPAVDVALRLARALDCRVEDLFGSESTAARVEVEATSEVEEGRVALAHIGGRWLSYPLGADESRVSADAILVPGRGGPAAVELVRPGAESRENVVMMGCAAALGLLADRLNARPGAGRFLWFSRSSTAALEAIGRGQAHLAGVHLVDGATGEANVPDVRRHAGAGTIALITLARWEVGLVTAPGNPRRIRTVADLGRRGLRLVGREPGSGARRLLELELERTGLSRELARTPNVRARGHLDVANAIAIGAGDVGVATRDAALAFRLAFVPIAEERYDLAIPLAVIDDPRLQRLIDTMTTGALRRELSSLGYDVGCCGDRVAEVRAA